jgi:protein-arginine kinase activator protein McsA
MDTNNIKVKYDALNKELKDAVARMERTDRVFVIRDAIKDLQKLCPHNNGSYDFSDADECPYCGKKFRK